MIYFSVRCNAHAQRTIFAQMKAFNGNRRVPRGFFGHAEFDFEIYFSVRCNAHAQRTIFTQIKPFNANRRVPREFLDQLNSISRSSLVYDATCMRSGRFSRKSKPLTQIGAYLGDFGAAEFDFEIYFSLGLHAHAQ